MEECAGAAFCVHRARSSLSLAPSLLGDTARSTIPHTFVPSTPPCVFSLLQTATEDTEDQMQWYRASKVKAEKACWKFVEEKDVSFDIVTINPPMIIGPWLPAYRRNNESSIILKEYLSGAFCASEKCY